MPKSSCAEHVLNQSNLQKVLNLRFVMCWNLIDIVLNFNKIVLNLRSTFKMFNFKTLCLASGNPSESAEPKNCDVLNLKLTFKVLNLN